MQDKKSQKRTQYNTKGITLDECIEELNRELNMRDANYPKWIKSGRLHKTRANKQYLRMLKTLQLLTELRDGKAPEVEIRQGRLF